MAISSSALRDFLIESSDSILAALSSANFTPPPDPNVSVKSMLESLLPLRRGTALRSPSIERRELLSSIKDFALACAVLIASESSAHELLAWIPRDLAVAASAAFGEICRAYVGCFGDENAGRIGELGLECCDGMAEEKRLVMELMPEVLPLLRERIKESSIDKSDDADGISAASANVPVGYAVVAAHQFRWFLNQVDRPYLGKLCKLVVPCALTTLDHWSPDVKEQGMIGFIHLAKNVNAADLGWYEDPILDACCQNIASVDEIWYHVIDMSVLLVTLTKGKDPRSPWFERMLNEMLSHLERQPRNRERHVAWLKLIDPLLNAVGLVLLSQFRRLFPLFFLWMHADDDETVLLVLQRVHTVIRLTWIRNTPFVERTHICLMFDSDDLPVGSECLRLVNELPVLYKEAALRRAREEIRTHILQILLLLQRCKGRQFEAAWEKHRNDPDLAYLGSSLSGMGKHTVNSGSMVSASE